MLWHEELDVLQRKGHWWAGRLSIGHSLHTERLRRHCAKRKPDNLVPSAVFELWILTVSWNDVDIKAKCRIKILIMRKSDYQRNKYNLWNEWKISSIPIFHPCHMSLVYHKTHVEYWENLKTFCNINLKANIPNLSKRNIHTISDLRSYIVLWHTLTPNIMCLYNGNVT